MVNHSHEKLSPGEISRLYNIAFMKEATIGKAVNGFRKTGIFTMDSDTFAKEEFLPCSLQEVDITEQGMENVTPATSPIMPSSTTRNRSVSRNMDLITSSCTCPSYSFQAVTPCQRLGMEEKCILKSSLQLHKRNALKMLSKRRRLIHKKKKRNKN
ncbi:hypothetical protein PR048_027568 [Dryococelus australis]|uniref:Uncharacterized protein n=1 Tax=Dryococelus australis TaxID=614101 RepID=A0ABQ9GGV6_9NEOP|nr:hypothetical protein PR048_027568 [Dryococelus australis]